MAEKATSDEVVKIINQEIEKDDFEGEIVEVSSSKIKLHVEQFHSFMVGKYTDWYVQYISQNDGYTLVLLRKQRF